MEVRDPVIVLGAPRSGTTVLAHILGGHPDVLLLNEPRLTWRWGNDTRSDELDPADARPEVVDHIHTVFGARLAASGRSRLAEKTPSSSLRPGFVDAVFPDARYLHIIRDGWDAVPAMAEFWGRRASGVTDPRQRAKLVKRWREVGLRRAPRYLPELARRLLPGDGRGRQLYGPRVAGLREIARDRGELVAAATQWRLCTERAATFGRALPPERYLELRLDELDRTAVGRVLAFCGLRADPDLVTRLAGDVDPSRITRHAQRLTPADRDRIAPYILPVEAWLAQPPGAGAPSVVGELPHPEKAFGYAEYPRGG